MVWKREVRGAEFKAKAVVRSEIQRICKVMANRHQDRPKPGEPVGGRYQRCFMPTRAL